MRTKNLSVTRPDHLNICQKVKSIITKYKKNDTFVVAVSGGSDSLALVSIIKNLIQENKYKFFFAIVDHNLRKKSAAEALSVKRLLSKYGINLTILKNKKKIDKNIQKNAREIRYNLLEKFCKKKKAKSLIVAHHQDDQVETFLIRLSRGSGVEGLSSMNEITTLKQGTSSIRPLLDFKKKELISITKHTFNKFFKDPSNKNRKFLRTNIRELKKNLEKKGIDIEKIVRSIKNIASTKEAINFYVERSIKKYITFKGKLTILDLEKLRQEPQEIKFKVINKIIKKTTNSYYPPRSKKVLNLIDGLQRNRIKKLTLGGCIFERKKRFLFISKEQ